MLIVRLIASVSQREVEVEEERVVAMAMLLVLVLMVGLFDDAANEVILASLLELTSRGRVASTSSVVVATLI